MSKKSIMISSLLICMIFTIAGCSSGNNNDAEYQAFYNFVSNTDSYDWENKDNHKSEIEWNYFALIDLDGDNTSELICKGHDSPSALNYYLIVDYYNDELAINEI